MPTMTPVAADDPLMIAWKAYQETEDFANTLNWLGKDGQDPKGTLWAAFMAGFKAGRMKEGVSIDFIDASAKAAIRALRELEQTAIMLEKWAPEVFPEINEQGQKHFGRVMMESAAEEIRKSWSTAIEAVKDLP
jgi:hypothetical protein